MKAKGATTIKISVDTAPFDAAVASLDELSHLAPGLFRAFFDSVDDFSQFGRLEQIHDPTAGAGDCRLLLQPTDRFRNFLAAAAAGNICCHGIDI